MQNLRWFLVTPRRLERAMGKGAALVVLNTPNNPTGRILRGDTLREIADMAAGAGAQILSDEVYDFFAYGHRTSAAAYASEKSAAGWMLTAAAFW